MKNELALFDAGFNVAKIHDTTIGGIDMEALTDFVTGQNECEVNNGAFGIRPTEIAGVSNEGNMNTSQLTALIHQLKFELQQAIVRITRLENAAKHDGIDYA